MKSKIQITKFIALLFLGAMVASCSSAKQKGDNNSGSSVSEHSGTIENLTFMERLRKFPGVMVKGTPEDPKIFIRGINTLNAGTDPLVVIDGSIYYGSIADINRILPANQIKGIRVLKEPGEVGIYGVMGGNGVIVVAMK